MAKQGTLNKILTESQRQANLCVEYREEALDAKAKYEGSIEELMDAMRDENVTEVAMRGVTFRRVESEKIKVEGKAEKKKSKAQ